MLRNPFTPHGDLWPDILLMWHTIEENHNGMLILQLIPPAEGDQAAECCFLLEFWQRTGMTGAERIQKAHRFYHPMLDGTHENCIYELLLKIHRRLQPVNKPDRPSTK